MTMKGIKVGRSAHSAGGTLQAVGRYMDGSVALAVVGDDGTPEYVATVCLPEAPPLRSNEVWLKDWTANEGVVDALVKAGAVRLTGLTWATGHVLAKHAVLTAATIELVRKAQQ